MDKQRKKKERYKYYRKIRRLNGGKYIKIIGDKI